ncbi:MAG: hydrogenase maturation protease [Anaerolineales bacterium]|nr:MAG: hydrogenase maturation protease [Anaerolineales bacterium]
MKTLVLGLGNPLLTDDGVGLKVAEELQRRLSRHADVEVGLDYWGGLRLMERMVDFDRAIIIDAIVSGKPPGTIQSLRPGDLPTQRSASAHDVTLPTALELGRLANLRLPQDEKILLIAIEAADVQTFSEELSPVVAAVIPAAVELVLSAIAQEWLNP